MTEAFSGPVNVFHERRLPETATPAGYAALIHAYRLPAPLPRTLSAIGSRHRVTEDAGWRESNNVRVLNDTGDFYRFFDATPHAEFLYACVRQTIEEDLPNEARFLRNFDQFRMDIENMIDMPERTLNNLFGFLRQNGGRLSKRARENEFALLTDDEVTKIEELYRASFGES